MDSPCCLQTQRLGHQPPVQCQDDSLAWPSRHAYLLRLPLQIQSTTFQTLLHMTALPGKIESCLCWPSQQWGQLLWEAEDEEEGKSGHRLLIITHSSKNLKPSTKMVTDLPLCHKAFCLHYDTHRYQRITTTTRPSFTEYWPHGDFFTITL